MTGEVCVVAETLRGEVTELTYTMLAAGRQLAEGLKTRLSALLIGHQVQRMTASLGAADRVVCVDDSALAEFNPQAYLHVVAEIFGRQTPRLGLFGHTAMGTDIACGVTQRLGAPIAVSCRTFSTDGGEPHYSSLICGGKIIAEGPLPGPCCLATVMTGGYKAEQGKVAKAPPVESLPVPEGLSSLRTRFKQYIEPPAGDVDITKQAIIVSVGRGIQNKDNLAMAEELAKAMGGVVSGSRPVIDQGWLPTTRLVGKSGKQVKPKLYLALGISGAPEHAEGIRDAEMIVAINRDEKAPIYGLAHVGAAVDVLEFVPVLTDKIKHIHCA
ncbi:MAG: electron transfer flavoprotein subunit alpha/FixB family protein [Phycisphaerae bacterium]